ncbi:MAG: hypothetical protein ACKO2G_16930 [Verrucomicrobiales bacterium]
MVANRSEASHFAGGLVLNAPDGSSRYSKDFDVFHDAVQDLTNHSERDVQSLRDAGFEVTLLERSDEWRKPASFRQAIVTRGGDFVTLDWAHDSAWRFFPIQEDEQLGWKLHLFDVAVNKALALAARSETRDYVDILDLARVYPLEAIVWAACGKDPGFSPLYLLKMMRRFAKIVPGTLEEIKARDLDPLAMKAEWTEICDQAEVEMIRLADTRLDMPIGVAFVDDRGSAGWIGRNPNLRIHLPSLRGCWPAIHSEL